MTAITKPIDRERTGPAGERGDQADQPDHQGGLGDEQRDRHRPEVRAERRQEAVDHADGEERGRAREHEHDGQLEGLAMLEIALDGHGEQDVERRTDQQRRQVHERSPPS